MPSPRDQHANYSRLQGRVSGLGPDKGHYGRGLCDSVGGIAFLVSGRGGLEENGEGGEEWDVGGTWHFRENRNAPKG